MAVLRVEFYMPNRALAPVVIAQAAIELIVFSGDLGGWNAVMDLGLASFLDCAGGTAGACATARVSHQLEGSGQKNAGL